MPNRILCVDTEAYINPVYKDGVMVEQRHTLRLGEAYYSEFNHGKWGNERRCSFTTAGEFHDFLNSLLTPKKKIRVIAHNMAYDAILLEIDSFLSNGWARDKWVLEPFIVTAHKDAYHLDILSSTNWFKKSLKETGKAFGVLKMDTPDFMNVDDETLREYCRNDAWVLLEIVRRYSLWIRENNLGDFADTIAGQAFNAYRHRWMPSRSIELHRWPEIEKLERASYMGGRCETFRIGEYSGITKLDVNSMYPFIMANGQIPNRLLSGVEPLDDESIWSALDSGRWVVAKVKLNMNEPAIPYKSNRLVFPIGRFDATLANPEISYILDNPEVGEIESIESGAVYSTIDLFSEYVTHFYDLKRLSKDSATVAMAKLFLNSLYGKFGQKANSELELYTNQPNIDAMMENDIFTLTDEELGVDVIRLGDVVYQKPKKLEESASNSAPIISSAITSASRAYLDSLIRKAGREHVLYVDTDSLFVDDVGLNALRKDIHPSRLGALKIEGRTDRCVLKGAKNYIFDDEVKIKGIRHDAILEKDGSYTQDMFCTKSTHYLRMVEPNVVVVAKVNKTLTGIYDKGVVHDDGTITPLVIA
jgi:hypothetical protein